MIIGFTGNRGSGKTLSMTITAYLKYLEGYTIYSNYKLNFPYTTYTMTDIENYAKSKEKFAKSIFLLDEAHVVVDSRTSGKKFSRIFSYWVTQTRKKDIDLYYTTQFSRQIDVRLRIHTDIVVQCISKSVVWFNNTQPVIKANYMPKGNESRVETFVLNTAIEFSFDGNDKVSRAQYHANKFFGLYDTTEVISTLECDT